MKLKELLDEIFKNQEQLDVKDFGFLDHTLYGKKHLEGIKDKLLETEEFSECESLEILDTPTILLEDKPLNVLSYNLKPNQKFKGKCYLLSLAFSPEIYDPNKLTKPVKDGSSITPTLYSPETFEPFKKIIMEFSPERVQDGISNHEAIIRQELHDRLDNILDNPKEYTIKGEKHILVRGIFEKNEVTEEVEPPKNLVGIKTDPEFCNVYYFEKEEKNGEIFMNLKTKHLPIKLREKFIEELGGKGIEVTKEEIEEFLEKNK